MVTEDRGTFKSFAKNAMHASFARPSTGGVVMESFTASPTSPVMAFFFARGWTFTAKVTPPLFSWIAIIPTPKVVILSKAKDLCNLLTASML
jgi:hypothetical protein